jgi:HNH endonuclease
MQQTYSLSDQKFRQAMWEAHKGYCFWTGQKLQSINDMHIDHIFPRAKGGLDILENLVCCAARVNLVKLDRTASRIDRMIYHNQNCFVKNVRETYIKSSQVKPITKKHIAIDIPLLLIDDEDKFCRSLLFRLKDFRNKILSITKDQIKSLIDMFNIRWNDTEKTKLTEANYTYFFRSIMLRVGHDRGWCNVASSYFTRENEDPNYFDAEIANPSIFSEDLTKYNLKCGEVQSINLCYPSLPELIIEKEYLHPHTGKPLIHPNELLQLATIAHNIKYPNL